MITTIIFDWNGTLYNRTEIFPFTKEILDYLKPKYKLILISKAKPNVEERRKLIDSLGLTHYFNVLIIQPDKDVEDYRKCIKKIGSTPEEVVIVDDRTLVGIKIGNQIGCKTFWINKGKFENELPNKETGEPTHIIESIKELPNYL